MGNAEDIGKKLNKIHKHGCAYLRTNDYDQLHEQTTGEVIGGGSIF